MTPLVIDFEGTYTKSVNLRKLSLRRYLELADVTAMAFKLGDMPVVVCLGMAEIQQMLPVLAQCFQSDDVIVKAFNDPFDLRLAHYKLGLPWPKHSSCVLDQSRGAWPNLFQSYGLDYLSKCIKGVPPKLDIDLHPGKHTDAELRAYVARDVEAAAVLDAITCARLPERELLLAQMTSQARQLSLAIDHTRGAKALDLFTKVIMDHAAAAAKGMDLRDQFDYASVFGLDGTKIRSVKPAGVKHMLMENLGFHASSISLKKLNPEQLRRAPVVGAALRDLGKVNSTLSHARRVNALLGNDVVDLNLRYAGSHTYRWTSTGEGRGINFLNLPKHDKAVAKPLRQMISVQGHVLVRGDAAALEYRMIGWWTECQHIVNMYLKDILASPYIEFGHEATGVRVSKKEPAYKVWKETVLGLSFLMRPRTHAVRLARLLATEAATAQALGTKPGITLDDMRDMCTKNGWRTPQTPYFKRMKTELGLDDAVLAVAAATHELFKQIHPEIYRKAQWLMQLFDLIARSSDVQRAIDTMYQSPSAPDKGKVLIEADPGMVGKSVKVTCGPWVPTLRWSDIGVHRTIYNDLALALMSTRGYKPITENLCVENITQAMGRNGIACGLLNLWDGSPQGRCRWPYLLNVHDEGLIAVPEHDTAAMCHARNQMIETFKPNGYVANQGFEWACIMDPSKVTLSRTLWDEDPDDIAPLMWDRIAAGDKSVLDLLP